MLAKNRSGWMVLEYMKVNEDEIVPFEKCDGDEMDEIILWDLKEDIGYVDECDLKMVEMSCTNFN